MQNSQLITYPILTISQIIHTPVIPARCHVIWYVCCWEYTRLLIKAFSTSICFVWNCDASLNLPIRYPIELVCLAAIYVIWMAWCRTAVAPVRWQRRQAMLQLHLSEQQIYCPLRCSLYKIFDGTSTRVSQIFDHHKYSVWTYAYWCRTFISLSVWYVLQCLHRNNDLHLLILNMFLREFSKFLMYCKIIIIRRSLIIVFSTHFLHICNHLRYQWLSYIILTGTGLVFLLVLVAPLVPWWIDENIKRNDFVI